MTGIPHVFLESAARPLLLLHAVVALAAIGACTHLVVVSIRLWRGNPHLGRLARIYAQVIGATYLVTFAAGLLLYPHYRYHVRGLYLDRYEPWASNLFDMKENFAGLGLPLAAGLFAVGRRFDPREDGPLVPWLTYLAVAVWAVVVSTGLLGLLVTSVKGV